LFSCDENYVNLARYDPLRLSWISGTSYIHRVGARNHPARFISTIVVDDCYLKTAKINASGAKPSRYISGSIIRGEFERMVGALGMVINKDEFGGQYHRDFLSFHTAMPPTASSKHLYSNIYSVGLNLNSADSSSYSLGKESPFASRRQSKYSSVKAQLSFTDIGE
jgi:hypothetical protein